MLDHSPPAFASRRFAARYLQGLERLDQIKYAILEAHGGITIIPRDEYR